MHPIVPLRVYATVLAALLALTALTVAVSFVHLGPFNLVVALSIAGTKAALVALWFMHLKSAPRLMWVAVGAGLVWLALLIALSLGDYVTREWVWVRSAVPTRENGSPKNEKADAARSVQPHPPPSGGRKLALRPGSAYHVRGALRNWGSVRRARQGRDPA